MADLKAGSNVPDLTASYMATLDQALTLQEHEHWSDYLLPVADTLAAISILVGNNVGHFMVLESNTASHRWIWLSLEAHAHLISSGWAILESAVDAKTLDVKQVYGDILKDLGRDTKGRKLRATDLVTK